MGNGTTDEVSSCCGNFADKVVMAKQLRVKGASEFLEFINANATEDMSEKALDELLLLFVDSM